MVNMALIEAQKERESGWVKRGVDRFQAFVDRSGGDTAVRAKVIMRAAYDRLTDALRAHMADPTKDRSAAVPVIMALGAEHVAALTLQVLIAVTAGDGPLDGAIRTTDLHKRLAITKAHRIGEAVEHDMRFRAWRKDAKGAEKAAADRMKAEMEAGERTVRRRLVKLRELGGEPWSETDHVRVGLDLIALATDAAPDVFSLSTIRHSGRTVTLLRLQDRVLEDICNAHTTAALATPKIGMMLVPPNDWRYAE